MDPARVARAAGGFEFGRRMPTVVGRDPEVVVGNILGDTAERHVKLLLAVRPETSATIAEHHAKLNQWKSKYSKKGDQTPGDKGAAGQKK
eukprot:g37.t1